MAFVFRPCSNCDFCYSSCERKFFTNVYCWWQSTSWWRRFPWFWHRRKKKTRWFYDELCFGASVGRPVFVVSKRVPCVSGVGNAGHDYVYRRVPPVIPWFLWFYRRWVIHCHLQNCLVLAWRWRLQSIVMEASALSKQRITTRWISVLISVVYLFMLPSRMAVNINKAPCDSTGELNFEWDRL